MSLLLFLRDIIIKYTLITSPSLTSKEHPMPVSSGPITRTITERTRAAPVPKIYTRTIDGVAANITIPEHQPIVEATSSSTRNHTDN